MTPQHSSSKNIFSQPNIIVICPNINIGSDYGYAWPDAIQIKGSVCHSIGMNLIA